LSFNATDYVQLDNEWKAAARRHSGIIVSARIQDIGELLRRVVWHLDWYHPVQQEDVLVWLGPAPRP
jgi:hypothetical protein